MQNDGIQHTIFHREKRYCCVAAARKIPQFACHHLRLTRTPRNILVHVTPFRNPTYRQFKSAVIGICVMLFGRFLERVQTKATMSSISIWVWNVPSTSTTGQPRNFLRLAAAARLPPRHNLVPQARACSFDCRPQGTWLQVPYRRARQPQAETVTVKLRHS